MATSSILHNVKIDSEEKTRKLLNAIEESKNKQFNEKKKADVYKMIDIVKVKSEIKKGILKVEINENAILLTHPMSGEAVKIADTKELMEEYNKAYLVKHRSELF